VCQLVRNLLGNALKVSPSSGVVEIRTLTSESALEVRVVDEGPGIPEGELEKIFEKFVQSSRTNTGAGGTGLGLAICRDTVSLHGGRIWAENVQPHGAAVCFELPRSEPVESRQRDAGERGNSESLDYPSNAVVLDDQLCELEKKRCLQDTAF
jgi:signal transduction histidine kinase